MNGKIMMALLVGASSLFPLAGSAIAGEAPLIAFYCQQRDDSFAGDPVTIKKVGGIGKRASRSTQREG